MSTEAIADFFAGITLKKLLPVALILLIGTVIIRLLLRLFDKSLLRTKLDRKIDKTLQSTFHTLLRVLLYSLLVLIALGSLGVDVTSLIALVSVLSLAISLAMQNVLTNVVGSIHLLAARPIRAGDFVQIGDDSGTVEEITMSYTVLLTRDGRRIYIPNSDAAAARICNYSMEGKRLIELMVTVDYAAPTQEAYAALREAAKHPKAAGPCTVRVNAFLDSAVEYRIEVPVASGDYAEVRYALLEQIKHCFDERKINIPFPQLDVHIDPK